MSLVEHFPKDGLYALAFIAIVLLIVFKKNVRLKIGNLQYENAEEAENDNDKKTEIKALKTLRLLPTYSGQIERMMLDGFRNVLGLDIPQTEKAAIKLLCSLTAKDIKIHLFSDVLANHIGENEEDIKTYTTKKAVFYTNFISNEIHRYNGFICSVDFVDVIAKIEFKKLDTLLFDFYTQIQRKTEDKR